MYIYVLFRRKRYRVFLQPFGRGAFVRGCFSVEALFVQVFSTTSAISRLFRSANGACVLPFMPVSGRWSRRASPPRLLISSTKIFAHVYERRQTLTLNISLGSAAMLSPYMMSIGSFVSFVKALSGTRKGSSALHDASSPCATFGSA